MRVKKLELCNFRQFCGLQTIEFSGADPTDTHNVTVVRGENGRGKTGLYRAVMYCLYGQKDLDQDKNYAQERDTFDTKSLYLVNLAALEEDAQSHRNGVEAFVRLSFTHHDTAYEMIRRLYGIVDTTGEILEEDRGVELAITDASGNTQLLNSTDEDRIKSEINDILDARVKSYFLFDGERIERLTKVTEQQRKEVALGIRNLLRIDELFKVEKAIKSLDVRLTKDLQKVSTGDYQKKLREREKLMEKQNALASEIDGIEQEIARAWGQIRELDLELRKFKDIEEQLLKRKQLEDDQQSLREQVADVRNQMRAFTPDASILLAKDVLDRTHVDIDQKRTKGQIPPDIKKELIERLLQEMRCVCGRPVSPESAEYYSLKAWDVEVSAAEAQREIVSLFSDLSRTAEHVDNKSAELITLLQKKGELEEYLDQVNGQLEDLSEQLGTVPDQDLASKNQARESIIKKIGGLDGQLGYKKSQMRGAEEDLARVEREIGPLQKQSQEHQQIARQLELVMKSKSAVRRVIEQFVLEVRAELEEKANHSFRRLLDTDGQKTIKALKIQDDYTLEVLDWKNRHFLANISAGQRQIVSLCFITALAQVAGGSTVLEVPLFMDTPFGRLSYEHRENLLTELPQITPQWILLATETELTEKEQMQLKQSGRWGKFYELLAGGEGVTTITERSVESLQTRGLSDGHR